MGWALGMCGLGPFIQFIIIFYYWVKVYAQQSSLKQCFIVPHSWKKDFSEKTLPVRFLFIHFVSKREKEALSNSKSTTLSGSSSCCLIILPWEADVHESQSTTVKMWGAKSALKRLCKTQDLISLFILSSIWSVSLQLFTDFLLFVFSICLLLLPIILICIII